MFPADGYPLKPYLLEKWIYDMDATKSFVAKRMKLSSEEFERRLREKEKFNRRELKALIMLMGAEAAFEVIYLPTKRIREQVWWEVFGQFQSQEELNE